MIHNIISNYFVLLQQKTKRFLKYNDKVFLGLIIILGLFLRVISWYFEPTLSRDGILYLDLIKVWYNQNCFQAVLEYWPQYWIPPFPLYLMKLLMDCGCPAEFAGVGLNMIMGCGIPLIVYGIAMEMIHKREIALCSALLITLNPSMIELSIEIQRDMIYLFFCGLLIYFLLLGIRRKKRYFWSAAGVFFAISYLTRYETLEFIPLALGCFVLLLIMDFSEWKKYIQNAVILCVTSAVTLFILIYAMGLQDHLYRTYLKYYQTRWFFFQKSYLEKGIKK